MTTSTPDLSAFEDSDLDDEARRKEARDLGRPGRPFDRRSPFFFGLTGALGVAVAFLIARTVFDAGEVLSLVLLALFIAMGLDPAVVWLERHGLRRWMAVLGTQRLTVKGRTLRATLDLQRRSHPILRHCAGEIVGR